MTQEPINVYFIDQSSNGSRQRISRNLSFVSATLNGKFKFEGLTPKEAIDLLGNSSRTDVFVVNGSASNLGELVEYLGLAVGESQVDPQRIVYLNERSERPMNLPTDARVIAINQDGYMNPHQAREVRETLLRYIQ